MRTIFLEVSTPLDGGVGGIFVSQTSCGWGKRDIVGAA